MPNENESIKTLSAELYDKQQSHTYDVEFILSVIGDVRKKVLEACCGSGRILVPIAKAGHDVTGFDIDDEMMNRIPKKAEGLKNISWRKADALIDDWGIGFDVVLLAGNVLFNIEINTDVEYKRAQELFIQKAADSLVSGGHVFIEYNPFAPNGRTLTRPGQSCKDEGNIVWSWEGTDDDGNYEKRSLTSGSFDEATGMLRAISYFEQKLANGKIIKEEHERVKHYATLEQIHDWLSAAGFIIEFEFEDFDKKPLDDDSCGVIIYACKK